MGDYFGSPPSLVLLFMIPPHPSTLERPLYAVCYCSCTYARCKLERCSRGKKKKKKKEMARRGEADTVVMYIPGNFQKGKPFERMKQTNKTKQTTRPKSRLTLSILPYMMIMMMMTTRPIPHNTPPKQTKTKQKTTQPHPRLPEPFFSIRVSCFLCDWEHLS